MMRFVVVSTAKRGVVKCEPLDEDGQMSAWAAYRLDMTVPLERVVWKDGFGPEPVGRVARMMDLARRAR